ncbi:extracellular solute-binding protein [Roseomonas sp. OT10]|uniref:extracellular solute-binding protein n=1 Tax=Roseomonas cutis TaxID=2897332 RepID=UPI001E4364D1|nr:extracellular solute-binding protein [Roseomonas sp. OT10]UFN47221.1 extracellular solute-binding protein [Roseomonas sp. OT10]
MRLRYLAAALTAALAATSGEARAQAAAPGGTATLLTYGGIFRDNYLDVVVKPFTQASGVTVQYGDPGIGGSAQFLGTLRAQKADPQVDVVIMDATTAAAACAEGLVEKLTAAEVPELAALDEQARASGNGCGPAVTYDHLVLIYDTQRVQPAPTRWADLANPAWKGQVSFTTLPNIQALAMVGILAHHASGDWKNIGAAIPLLRQIAPNVQTFEPSPDGYSMVLSEQVRFATGWNARAQLYSDQSKGRLGTVIPQEGTAFQINTINLVARGPNRAAGLAFLRHALSTPAQVAFTDRMFYGPTNVEAQRTASAIGRTALAPQYRERIAPIEWLEAVRLRDGWNQRWRREVMTAAAR